MNAHELNILIVEKEGVPDWERIKASLKRRDIKAFSASGVKEAYALLRAEPINIVVSDYNLPEVGGLNFLKRLKKIKPHVEVIFLSEKVPLSRATEAMKLGAYDFYEFPINIKLLLAVVGKAVEKQALFFEKVELERRMKEKFNFSNIIGRSKPMQRVTEIIGSVAPRNVNVLITGETGTGKEMIANAIHFNSPRASKPFIKINCAALNEGVLESEMFGHERGAFTGAVSKRIGRFELASGGTLFLDEVGDIPPATQSKLLRVLQEREFERVGGNDSIKVDVRVIAATNTDLKRLIDERRFREDLYYRLNVVHIETPPLRERSDDIPLLTSYFINKLDAEKGYDIKGVTKEAMQILLNYAWPGNVRELENAIESAMALSRRDVIEAKYLPSFLLLPSPEDGDFYQIPSTLTLREIEDEVIRLTLKKTGGNRTQAARLLGIGLRTLQRNLKGY